MTSKSCKRTWQLICNSPTQGSLLPKYGKGNVATREMYIVHATRGPIHVKYEIGKLLLVITQLRENIKQDVTRCKMHSFLGETPTEAFTQVLQRVRPSGPIWRGRSVLGRGGLAPPGDQGCFSWFYVPYVLGLVEMFSYNPQFETRHATL